MKSGNASWDAALAAALRAPPALTAVEEHNLDVYRWRDEFHLTRGNELIHVLQGQARIEGRNWAFHAGPGDTFVLPVGAVHRDHCPVHSNYSAIYVFFEWPAGRRLINAVDPDILCEAPAGLKAHLHWMIKELQDEYLGELPGAVSRMRVMLLEILLCLYRQSRKCDAGLPQAKDLVALQRRRSLARQVREHLLAHIAEGLDLEKLADSFNVSPFHLCRAFSQEFRMSMTEMLAVARMERARELLRNPDVPVKLVAAQVGLSDPNYFAKVFRRMTGSSPSEFRLSAAKGRVSR